MTLDSNFPLDYKGTQNKKWNIKSLIEVETELTSENHLGSQI
jgi:hypothetical protein